MIQMEVFYNSDYFAIVYSSFAFAQIVCVFIGLGPCFWEWLLVCLLV